MLSMKELVSHMRMRTTRLERTPAGIFFFLDCCPDSSAMGVFLVADKIDEGIYPKEMV